MGTLGKLDSRRLEIRCLYFRPAAPGGRVDTGLTYEMDLGGSAVFQNLSGWTRRAGARVLSMVD